MVEGQSRDREVDNALGNLRAIHQYVTGRNPQRFDALRCQPGIASLVSQGSVRTVMIRAVDLDRQTSIRAVEVEHQFAAWMLATEFDAFGRAFKMLPEKHLRQAHDPAQPTGTGDCSDCGPWGLILEHEEPLHHPLRGWSPSPSELGEDFGCPRVPSHPEHPEPGGLLDGRVEARGEGQAQHVPRLRRVDDTVVP